MQPEHPILISKPAVAHLTATVPEFGARLQDTEGRASACYRYPDGSIQLEGLSDSEWQELCHFLYEKLVPVDADGIDDVDTHFRSLAPFGSKSYRLWYTAEYAKKLGGEQRLLLLPGHPCPDEYKLECLPVTVPFRRKPTKKVLDRLAECLTAWFESVSKEGMFGEGPVDSISGEMEIWSARVVQFTLDVHRSGQNTLNWLTLSLLNFAYEASAITGIFYDSMNNPTYPDYNFLEGFLELRFENPFRVPIKVTSKAVSATASEPKQEEESPMSRLPPACTPHPSLRSEAFGVFLTDRYQWDDLQVRVYFGPPVQSDAQRLFQSLISSWMDLGTFGAWGGTGIHSGTSAQFDVSGEHVVFSVDMGDSTDGETALTVLVRVLEGFNRQVPIDAVVFGKLR
jgi:hypothetical protein